jgi:hypothetical protein
VAKGKAKIVDFTKNKAVFEKKVLPTNKVEYTLEKAKE